ncbi:hypothetical protein SMICM304S_04438 [Streptomyces microflavus]
MQLWTWISFNLRAVLSSTRPPTSCITAGVWTGLGLADDAVPARRGSWSPRRPAPGGRWDDVATLTSIVTRRWLPSAAAGRVLGAGGLGAGGVTAWPWPAQCRRRGSGPTCGRTGTPGRCRPPGEVVLVRRKPGNDDRVEVAGGAGPRPALALLADGLHLALREPVRVRSWDNSSRRAGRGRASRVPSSATSGPAGNPGVLTDRTHIRAATVQTAVTDTLRGVSCLKLFAGGHRSGDWSCGVARQSVLNQATALRLRYRSCSTMVWISLSMSSSSIETCLRNVCREPELTLSIEARRIAREVQETHGRRKGLYAAFRSLTS